MLFKIQLETLFDLLMLQTNLKERLVNVTEIKKHEFFAGIEWSKLASQKGVEFTCIEK